MFLLYCQTLVLQVPHLIISHPATKNQTECIKMNKKLTTWTLLKNRELKTEPKNVDYETIASKRLCYGQLFTTLLSNQRLYYDKI